MCVTTDLKFVLVKQRLLSIIIPSDKYKPRIIYNSSVKINGITQVFLASRFINEITETEYWILFLMLYN